MISRRVILSDLTLWSVLGCAALTLCLAPNARAQTFEVIHTFNGRADGASPGTKLIFDSTGNLYGATKLGGNISDCEGFGCGVVYKLSLNSTGDWMEKPLFRFLNSDTGGYPYRDLVLNSAGNLFGVANYGGGSSNCATFGLLGCGVAFELSPTSSVWKESVLHAFDLGSDGGLPTSGLVADGAGNLYGTTQAGGDLSMCSGVGCGTVFRLSPDGFGGWQETTLYTFSGGTDGSDPQAPLIFDATGNLYSTTALGGNLRVCQPQGCGVVFQLSPTDGGLWKETVLYTFKGGSQGFYSLAGLVLDSVGDLYGTIYEGGNLDGCEGRGCGGIFKLSRVSDGTWKETTLHTFSGNDGANPSTEPVFDSSGALYGVTHNGGNSPCGCGLIFKLSPQSNGGWKETVLHAFSGGRDGAGPAASLALGTDGNIYGTTDEGGYSKANAGVVFKITP